MVDASKARSISSKKLLVTALFVATVYSRILYVLHTLGRFLHYNKTAGNKHDRLLVQLSVMFLKNCPSTSGPFWIMEVKLCVN